MKTESNIISFVALGIFESESNDIWHKIMIFFSGELYD